MFAVFSSEVLVPKNLTELETFIRVSIDGPLKNYSVKWRISAMSKYQIEFKLVVKNAQRIGLSSKIEIISLEFLQEKYVFTAETGENFKIIEPKSSIEME